MVTVCSATHTMRNLVLLAVLLLVAVLADAQGLPGLPPLPADVVGSETMMPDHPEASFLGGEASLNTSVP